MSIHSSITDSAVSESFCSVLITPFIFGLSLYPSPYPFSVLMCVGCIMLSVSDSSLNVIMSVFLVNFFYSTA